MPRVMTVKTFARVMDVSLPIAYRMVRDGTVKSVKIGKVYRIDSESVKALFKGGENEPGESGESMRAA